MAVLNYDILLTKKCNGYEEDLFITKVSHPLKH